ncbi:SGNH hydrolase domain-containing protein [Arthrobacter sp. G.S.26]|uniref:SGNH hydrolase domain-containing protein n=1 Tax=Arthrobacter sp. G.S.26 TaxID=3433706 RepID=UPI003D7871B6
MRALKSLAFWKFAGLGILAVATVLVIIMALRPVKAEPISQEQVARIEAAQEKVAERVAAEKAMNELMARCLGAPARDAATGCTSENIGNAVYPQAPAKDAKAYCWTNAGDQPLDSCAYGSKLKGAVRVAVVGDSHARHLMPGLESVADAEKWAIDSYFGNGCTLTIAPAEACATAGAALLPALTQGKPYDIVVVSVSRRKAVDTGAVRTAVHQVQKTGAKVVIMEDVPTTTPEAIACSTAANFDVKATRCGVPTVGMKADLMAELGRNIGGVGIGVISPYFCDADWCPSVIGNAHVYADEGAHMTATYSRTVGPYVAAAIKAAAQTK